MPLGTSGAAGWEPHHLDEEQKPEEPADLKVEATSPCAQPDKTTTDRRVLLVPEGHSAAPLLSDRVLVPCHSLARMPA